MSTAIVKRPESAREVVEVVRSRIETIASVCPFGERHANRIVETFALVAIRMKEDDLLACSMRSIVQAVTTCARLGLDPSGHNNSAHFVKFGNELQLLPGYNGLIELACRNGKVSHIDAQAVYEGDRFEVHMGTQPQLIHDPLGDGNRLGQATVVYAIAWMPSGLFKFEVMTRGEIERIRNASRSKNSPAWSQHWNQMARKTVIRRLVKTLPSTPELNEAVGLVDMIEGAAPIERVDADATPLPEAEQVRALREQDEPAPADWQPITPDDIDQILGSGNGAH